ncbi:MAG: carboxypeptidase regulatory-like domain-containing protein [Acetobacteraceae bacterium]|nr:carboxypeptidase regulatory-like domain-containing protein [Acetobacteraceae bacterium]
MTVARQVAVLFLLMLGLTSGVAALSDRPRTRMLADDMAMLTITFSHGADRRGECRRLSQEELARLPPNMRRPVQCPRGRLPVLLELDLDGAPLLHASLPPTGLSGDGPSQVYRRFALPAGEHEIAVRLRDSRRETGFDHARTERVQLVPGQNLVIDFRPDSGFIVR